MVKTEATLRREAFAQSVEKISFMLFSHGSSVLFFMRSAYSNATEFDFDRSDTADGVTEKNKSQNNSRGQDVETLHSKFVCSSNN